jgi:dolichol kinase
MGINFKRKLFHISFGLIIFFLTYYLPLDYVFYLLAGLWIGLSIFEFWRIFFYEKVPLKFLWEPLLKSEERKKINDAWFFLIGLIFASVFLEKHEFRTILLVLSLADPLACIIGVPLGKHKIYKNKSLEGTLTFLITALLICISQLHAFSFKIFMLALIFTLAEVFTRRDNFWIPFSGTVYLTLIKLSGILH